MGNSYLDELEIERALTTLKQNQVFEIRVLKGKKVFSAYFDNPKTAISALRTLDLAGANVYFTPQKVHEGCSARLQWEKFLDTSQDKIPTTSDNDIVGYNYLLIDLDPVRPAGISSTDGELKEAEDIKDQILPYLEAQGFNNYVVACSGNGYHILAKIDLPATTEARDQVKGWLNRLDEIFSTDQCHVDIGNFNPGRIFKL